MIFAFYNFITYILTKIVFRLCNYNKKVVYIVMEIICLCKYKICRYKIYKNKTILYYMFWGENHHNQACTSRSAPLRLK